MSASITPADDRMVRRLVGFLEYGMALDYFDELVRRASEDELKVIDEFVAENETFSVYTNLTRRVPSGPTSLAENTSASDNYQRRGLAWVMALARVELGAMLATFTANPQPFATTNPSRFELEAYKSLLLDGARTHYWALNRDPDLQKVTRTSPVNPIVLSYSRRLALARAMLRAAIKTGGSEYNPLQLRELASWTNDLDGIQAGLVAMIQAYLLRVETLARTTSETNDFLIACGRLLRMEKKELKAGTARVKSYGSNN